MYSHSRHFIFTEKKKGINILSVHVVSDAPVTDNTTVSDNIQVTGTKTTTELSESEHVTTISVSSSADTLKNILDSIETPPCLPLPIQLLPRTDDEPLPQSSDYPCTSMSLR